MNVPAALPRRFASVDALRGFTVAAMLLVNNPGDWGHVYAPLQHAAWHGATPTDLIFPMFLFVVGVSLALAFGPRLDRGDAPAPMLRAALVRAARIVALGLVLHLCAWLLLDQPQFRPWGVLQRIGLCFAAAAVAALFLRSAAHWIVIVLLLLASWGLLLLGSLAPLDNLYSRVDTALFAPWLYQFDATTGRGHDPEGLLSTLPALATTLLGLRAGTWLRAGRVRALLVASVASLVLAWAWSRVLPLNKNLWTASYVAWAAGWSCIALATCHVLIDQRGWPALGRRFGVNAIAVYGGSALMVYVFAALGWWQAIYAQGFEAWIAPTFGPHAASLAFALAFVALWWCVAWWLDQRRIHIRI